MLNLKLFKKRVIQKTVEATGDLICNETADKITKVSRTSPQNISVTVTNETKIIGLDIEILEIRKV